MEIQILAEAMGAYALATPDARHRLEAATRDARHLHQEAPRRAPMEILVRPLACVRDAVDWCAERWGELAAQTEVEIAKKERFQKQTRARQENATARPPDLVFLHTNAGAHGLSGKNIWGEYELL